MIHREAGMGRAIWILAALVVVYVGAYLLLLERRGDSLSNDRPMYYIAPLYRIRSGVVVTLLRPAHSVDRRWIRPSYWKYDGIIILNEGGYIMVNEGRPVDDDWWPTSSPMGGP